MNMRFFNSTSRNSLMASSTGGQEFSCIFSSNSAVCNPGDISYKDFAIAFAGVAGAGGLIILLCCLINRRRAQNQRPEANRLINAANDDPASYASVSITRI